MVLPIAEIFYNAKFAVAIAGAGAAIDAFLAFRAGRPTPAIADLKALIEDGRE